MTVTFEGKISLHYKGVVTPVRYDHRSRSFLIDTVRTGAEVGILTSTCVRASGVGAVCKVRITSIRTSSTLIDIDTVITGQRSIAVITGVTGGTGVACASVGVFTNNSVSRVPRSAGTVEGTVGVCAGCVGIAVVRFGSALVYIDAVMTEFRSFAIFAGVAGITSDPFTTVDVNAGIDAELIASITNATIVAVCIFAVSEVLELAGQGIDFALIDVVTLVTTSDVAAGVTQTANGWSDDALIDVDLTGVTLPASAGTVTGEPSVGRIDVRAATAMQAWVGVAGIDFLAVGAITFVTGVTGTGEAQSRSGIVGTGGELMTVALEAPIDVLA